MSTEQGYAELLRLVDTRAAGVGFPDLLAAPARADRLAEFGLPTAPPQERSQAAADLDDLRALRDSLVRIVLSETGLRTRIRDLNQLLAAHELTPQLGDDLSVRYVSPRSGPIAELACRVLPQALRLLRSGDLARLGLCAARDCAAPFVESAGGKSRSYCSDRCAGRERVRRHRSKVVEPTRGAR